SWNYEVFCSNTEDTGLHGQKGTLTAEAYTGDNPLLSHGRLRGSADRDNLTYGDGTPFFWLGDTNWQAPNYVSLTRCNYPGCYCSSQFRHEVDDRLAKGFTVYQTYFDSAESDGGGQLGVNPEPSMWSIRHKLPDTKVFTEKYDKMFDYLAEKGMVIALGFGVHAMTIDAMDKEDLERISRYLTARYAAYPVIWITAQEITGEPQFGPWVRTAEITRRGDGYRHPQSAHMFPMKIDNEYAQKLNGMGWHGFYTLQNGHGAAIAQKSTYRGFWDTGGPDGRPKPFVEAEANYEDVYCGGFNGYEASRISAWKAALCGCGGFTYGVTGVWANCWSTFGDTGWMGTFSPEPWYMGLSKPGSFEAGYMAAFMKAAGFEALIPRFDDGAWSDFNEQKVLASTEDGSVAAAYFYNNDLSTGTIKGLDDSLRYRGFWFDPLTGKYIPAGRNIKPQKGAYALPQKPNTGDWAFLLSSRILSAPGPTEAMPAHPGNTEFRTTDFPGSLQKPVITSLGSAIYGAEGLRDTAPALTDGDILTEWLPFAPEATQTIVCDLRQKKALTGINIIFGDGSFDPHIRIMGSVDGKSQTVLQDTKTAGKGMFKNNKYGERYVFSRSLNGKYRYVTVLVFGSGDRNTPKSIAELELWAK
ncbi:MAG: DUF4038 domain-containing protein, partial [Abditibacteriota bacterium]|nr:DUF4038 domain-containing protein [Abditibacteriota bacterium]